MLKALSQLTLIIFHAAVCFAVPRIEIKDAWVREVPPSSSTTAVYMTIENRGEEDDRLIAVDSTASNFAELHMVSIDEKSVAKMKRVDAIDIPGGKSVMLKPGGYHIMLIELKNPLKKGDKIELDLRFQKYGAVRIRAEVREGPDHKEHHMNH